MFLSERLIEIRTVLERIRPIDQKLKYQIEKFVKISLTGTSDKNDPSRFRANPANMMSGVRIIHTSMYCTQLHSLVY